MCSYEYSAWEFVVVQQEAHLREIHRITEQNTLQRIYRYVNTSAHFRFEKPSKKYSVYPYAVMFTKNLIPPFRLLLSSYFFVNNRIFIFELSSFKNDLIMRLRNKLLLQKVILYIHTYIHSASAFKISISSTFL